MRDTENKLQESESKYSKQIDDLNDELDELTETILNKKDLEIKFDAERTGLINKINILTYQNQEHVNIQDWNRSQLNNFELEIQKKNE